MPGNWKDNAVNQKAEGETHFNRLSCETNWRSEALLCLPGTLLQICYLGCSPVTTYVTAIDTLIRYPLLV